MISDVTSEVENQRAAALQEETVRIFHACQRDRVGFIDFFVNARELVEQLTRAETAAAAELARAVHTLKGNCALFGVFSMSSLCHELEDNMAENGGRLGVPELERLRRAWAEFSSTVARIIGEHGVGKLEVGDEEYSAIVDAVASGVPRREIADDGRGIDWTKVAGAAKSKGLPHATPRELEDALFADGVSTVDVVTEWSGRGVGMSAVREACRRLGGIVEIETALGRGTTIRCSFAEHTMDGPTLADVRDRPVQASLLPAIGA